MKKIFTLIAMALMVIGAQAQRIDFESGTLEESYEKEGFKLEYVDTESKLAVDANNCYFGTAEANEKFTKRLKSGGKSSSKNNITLTIPSAGTLKVYARTGSNSATDRTIVLKQNDTELYNAIVLESSAIKVTGLDGDDPSKETSIYPIISVEVVAGKVEVTYPVGSMNFYAFELVSTSGINTVKAGATENGATYNLAGQKVDENYKGVVIQNGKKVVVK